MLNSQSLNDAYLYHPLPIYSDPKPAVLLFFFSLDLFYIYLYMYICVHMNIHTYVILFVVPHAPRLEKIFRVVPGTLLVFQTILCVNERMNCNYDYMVIVAKYEMLWDYLTGKPC